MYLGLCRVSRYEHNAEILRCAQDDGTLYGGAGGFMREGTMFMSKSWLVRIFAAGAACLTLGLCGMNAAIAQGNAQAVPAAPPPPWMDKSLDADKRADLMIHEMTLDEKIQLVHGAGWGVLRPGAPVATGHNGGAGFVPGIPRLHLPDINLADSAVGVRMAAPESRYATLLPSVIGMAASWDPDAAFLYGSVIGRELRAQGYNMSIGGGMDLIREPRNGRNFEYASEDPILAGMMVGQVARGVQSNHIMGDIKHYAVNDQETGRNILNAVMDKRTLRETDLLAFQIAITMAHPAGVMCAYNHINGDYSCENDYTLNQVLKKDWGFQGFVLSDWGGTHSTVKAALAGLDMDQPGDDNFFSDPLKQAVQSGQVPEARLDDMVHRIVRSMFVSGVIDQPPLPRSVVDPFRGRDDAQKIEEESLVLLQNTGGILPLAAAKTKSIAIIGGHADVAVLSGGGSAQVDSPGGNAIAPGPGSSPWGRAIYFPSSPMRYIREQAAASTQITYDAGTDPAAAAKAAASAQIAIVFVTQWMTEGQDSATLSLPDKQDDLVAAVAAANPNTIVVLENGGPGEHAVGAAREGDRGELVSGDRRRRGHCEHSVWPRESVGQAAGDVCRFGRPTAAPQGDGTDRADGQQCRRGDAHPATAAAHGVRRGLQRGGHGGGLSLVPGEEPEAAVRVWLWAVVHALRLLQPEGGCGREERQLRSAQYGSAGRRRDCRGLRHAAERGRRAVPQAGGMEARLAGCRSEPDGDSGARSAVSIDLFRRHGQMVAAGGRVSD